MNNLIIIEMIKDHRQIRRNEIEIKDLPQSLKEIFRYTTIEPFIVYKTENKRGKAYFRLCEN